MQDSQSRDRNGVCKNNLQKILIAFVRMKIYPGTSVHIGQRFVSACVSFVLTKRIVRCCQSVVMDGTDVQIVRNRELVIKRQRFRVCIAEIGMMAVITSNEKNRVT